MAPRKQEDKLKLSLYYQTRNICFTKEIITNSLSFFLHDVVEIDLANVSISKKKTKTILASDIKVT